MSTKFTKVHARRLTKLANHLLTGKLGHKEFDFTCYNRNDDYTFPSGCGTIGCAMGESPIVFPKQWMFKKGNGPYAGNPVLKVYKHSDCASAKTSGMDFYGLTPEEYCQLFIPDGGWPVGLGRLGPKATRKQVARHILKFVKAKLEGGDK